MSTLALIIGLVIVNVVKPGAGMNVDPATLDTKAIEQYTHSDTMKGVADYLLHLIPTSVVDAFAKGEILQVLVFSVLFGFALHKIGRDNVLFQFIEKFSKVLFAIVGMIMRLAPLGAFGAMAFTIGKYGVGTLASLGKLMVCFYATCLLLHLRRARAHRTRARLPHHALRTLYQGRAVHRARRPRRSPSCRA